MQHLIDLDDYPVSWWNRVIALGKDIYTNPGRYKGACSGKVMGTLFYEPSTRTQMSFQTAMLRLGGSLIGFDNPATSSVSKGENLKDTTKIVSGYSDVLVIRHPLEGAAKAAALTAECPVINAGDGGHLHPTQTLTDMLTLTMEKGRLSGLTIGMCGDLLNGRTVHSLCKALSCYPDNKFIFISTPELMVPQYVKDILNSHGCEYREVSSLEETIPELDVLYMTRIQSERFASVEEYEAQKNVYVLDRKKLNLGKSDLIVLHPLPRVDEITMDVDEDSRALYFKQTKYGVYVRMALVLTMIENKDTVQLLKGDILKGTKCTNPRCITHAEKYLPESFIKSGDIAECEFCDERILL
ncbi:MAG: aspartate carbamoyltransferase [Oscillospiraceae bacterium]|nr:aspartate carbamoyltransferase [Oscillospiraceae bacterium]MBQ5336006.1 aspartate carbamoyltransferase [Oscillospiraceae bacterium]MBR3022909.1 aspartate carbamoyltransferase [Oscillospiraceae bacterium]MBR3534748.1 aspartate carbamoyltransferase [Oscillospiraceae bacterium]MBR6835563.1 aspartate carbamoyltransferase [Oscillospiraceae bacterium]